MATTNNSTTSAAHPQRQRPPFDVSQCETTEGVTVDVPCGVRARRGGESQVERAAVACMYVPVRTRRSGSGPGLVRGPGIKHASFTLI